MNQQDALTEMVLLSLLKKKREDEKKKNDKKTMDLENIRKFNENPRQFTSDKKMELALSAKGYGVTIDDAVANDKPSLGKKVVAGVGGALDSLLFGVLKNDWYSNKETEGVANIGRLAGTAAGFFLPGVGMAKGLGGILGMLGGGKRGLSALSALGTMASVKKGGEGISALLKGASLVDKGADAENIVSALGLLKKAKEAKDVAAVVNKAAQGVQEAKALKVLNSANVFDPLKFAYRGVQATNVLGQPVGFKTPEPDYTDTKKLLDWQAQLEAIMNGTAMPTN